MSGLSIPASDSATLTFDAVGATLKRTLLGRLRPGDRVNLEPSLRLGAAVDGHLVTGHVDGLGTVEARRPGDGAVFFDITVTGDVGDPAVGFASTENLVTILAPDGSTVELGEGQYAINEPGVWHTADVAGEATALFITAGLGTEHRPR